MNKITKLSLVAALAGFLFGFDTVVISGADQQLQALWNSSDGFHGIVVMGMALWGTVIGAIFGGFPTNRIGRKKTLLWIGIFYTISAVGSALANDPIVFAIFRFIGGLGVGASTIAAPAYISEIAPAKDRGRLVGMYQFNIVFGILIAYLSNYLIAGNFGENDWRWMMGTEALPAFIYTFMVIKIPFSPRWLVSKYRNEEAKEVLNELNSDVSIEVLIADHEKDQNSESQSESVLSKSIVSHYYLRCCLLFSINFQESMPFCTTLPESLNLQDLDRVRHY